MHKHTSSSTRPNTGPTAHTSPAPAAGETSRLSAVGRYFVSVLPGTAVLVVGAVIATRIASISSALSPLVVAVVIGAIAANAVTPPAVLSPGIAFGARRLLRVGVVLLGLRLSLGAVADLGVVGIVVVVAVVGITFFGTQLLGRRLGVSRDLALLVATGYSICGASAIAAMDGVIDADEEEAAYAITLVTICGTLSIFVLPLLGDALGMTSQAFGTFVGGAVHDVGQVVATASTRDAEALTAATVVKLSRVILLAPLVALVSIRRRSTSLSGAGRSPAPVPLFVIGFLVAVGLRSTEWLSTESVDAAARAEKAVLTVALVGLGFGVQLSKMSRLGGRPLLLGAVAWVLVAGAALAGTTIAV